MGSRSSISSWFGGNRIQKVTSLGAQTTTPFRIGKTLTRDRLPATWAKEDATFASFANVSKPSCHPSSFMLFEGSPWPFRHVTHATKLRVSLSSEEITRLDIMGLARVAGATPRTALRNATLKKRRGILVNQLTPVPSQNPPRNDERNLFRGEARFAAVARHPGSKGVTRLGQVGAYRAAVPISRGRLIFHKRSKYSARFLSVFAKRVSGVDKTLRQIQTDSSTTFKKSHHLSTAASFRRP